MYIFIEKLIFKKETKKQGETSNEKELRKKKNEKSKINQFRIFVAKSIISGTLGEIKVSVSDLPKLNHKSYKNIFHNGLYEFNMKQISSNNWEFLIYEIPIAKSYNFQIGCELEICIDKKCVSNPKLLGNLKLKIYDEDKIEIWKDLIVDYIKTIVLSTPDTKFLEKYPFIYIALNPKDGLYDYRINTKTKTVQKYKDVIFNDYIVFTRDESVKCDDKSGKDEDNKTFHCEIVSPVFKNTKDIELFYNNIIRKHCIVSNSSAGFHVNISMISNNKYIYYTEALLSRYIEYFDEYESGKYSELRPEGTKFAKKIMDYIKDNTLEYANLMIVSNDVHYYNNFLKGKKYYRTLVDLKTKNNTLHQKNPFLMEIRLFPSKEDVNILMSYIEDSIGVLKLAVDDYIENYNKIINDFQELNLVTILDDSPIETYKGYLYVENLDSIQKVESNNHIDDGIKYIFNLHNQDVKKILHEQRQIIVKDIDRNYKYIYEYSNDDLIYNIQLLSKEEIKDNSHE